MSIEIDIPRHGPSFSIWEQCESFLNNVLQSKFGCMAKISDRAFEGNQAAAAPTSVPKKRFQTLVSNVKVSVYKADLSKFPVDAVVNAANEHLEHAGGLAWALVKAGGPQIQKDSKDYIRKNGSLRTGQAVAMDPGLLPCLKIIHAVGPRVSGQSLSHSPHAPDLLATAVLNSLKIAEDCHLKSVALPAISSGLFGYPLQQCADTIVAAVKRFCEKEPITYLKEILLVNIDDRTVTAMENACRQIFSTNPASSSAGSKNPKSDHHSTYAVHVGPVCLTLKEGYIEEEQILSSAVSECLLLACTRQHQSIAFPAMGTRFLGFRSDEVAQIMSEAVLNFAKTCKKTMEVYFVIYPSEHNIFKAFKEQMTSVQQKKLQHTHGVAEHGDDFSGSGTSTTKIRLSGHCRESVQEARSWLTDVLLRSSKSRHIQNNFITYFGEDEHRLLTEIMRKHNVSIEQVLRRGKASIVVTGKSINENVAVAFLEVEDILFKIQREFVEEEAKVLSLYTHESVWFRRSAVPAAQAHFTVSHFNPENLEIVKVESIDNPILKQIFNLKKKQLKCSTTQKMLQRIPVHFRDVVSHIGFQAELAPPDETTQGQGIYFTGKVSEAMQLWSDTFSEYLYFVEADVLTGRSVPGKPELILPPPLRADPLVHYDSVSGGSGISVIFTGYQALPVNIITCKNLHHSKVV